jgi:hypothetical protein
MAKEYKLTAFEKGDFQDTHGNFWCTAVLQGIGEPVKMVVKDPMKFEVGMELYGEVKTQKSKAGKDYLRFYRETPPEQQTFNRSAGGGKPSFQPRDDAGIKAQFAIKAAIQYHAESAPLTDIEEAAKAFYKMVDRVKESHTASTSPGETKEFSTEEDTQIEGFKEELNAMGW